MRKALWKLPVGLAALAMVVVLSGCPVNADFRGGTGGDRDTPGPNFGMPERGGMAILTVTGIPGYQDRLAYVSLPGQPNVEARPGVVAFGSLTVTLLDVLPTRAQDGLQGSEYVDIYVGGNRIGRASHTVQIGSNPPILWSQVTTPDDDEDDALYTVTITFTGMPIGSHGETLWVRLPYQADVMPRSGVVSYGTLTVTLYDVELEDDVEVDVQVGSLDACGILCGGWDCAYGATGCTCTACDCWTERGRSELSLVPGTNSIGWACFDDGCGDADCDFCN